MASVAAPYGMVPYGPIGGRDHNHAMRQFSIASGYATNIFFGDTVKLAADGTVEKDTGTTTATPVGVFMGCFFTHATFGPTYSQMWPASTVASDAKAYVVDDNSQVFKIQADGTVALTSRGLNAGFTLTAGNTLFGKSKNALAIASIATTNTLPLRIVDFVNGPESAIGDAFTDVIVKWNAGHVYDNTTGV